MSKRINFFLLLTVITVFAACNNVNKPAETVKEQSQKEASMSAKEIAMSDQQQQKKLAGKSMKETNTNETEDLSAGKGRTSSVAPAPMTDGDKLRQMAAAKKVNAQNASQRVGDATPNPAKVVKKKTTIKDSKVATPTVNTPTVNTPTTEMPEVVGAPTHEDWNALLTKYVSNAGKVNYGGLKAAQSKLNTYLDKLKNNPPAATWSRNEKMAYWINAYNAFTIRKILDNYPLGSIQELSGGKVWDDKWINIGNKTYSLNEIENGILRPTYKDARIHFAVNCAAKSCPSIYNRAFTAANLESNLEKLTKKFVNNTNFNTITADKVTVSKIFDWYSSDFGDLITFLNKYSDTQINSGATVDYTDYDWALNE